jgi:hypothetical protein
MVVPVGASPVAVDPECPLQSVRFRAATFSRDGDSLYVTEAEAPMIDRETGWVVQANLVRIDVASGAVEASVQVDHSGQSFLWPNIAESPDGANLYVERSEVQSGNTAIQRRDPETLMMLAEREYDTPQNILITVK